MAAIAPVYKFFKDAYLTMAAFKADWDQLTDEDKEQLAEGCENGSLTY